MAMTLKCSCGNELVFEEKVDEEMPSEFTIGLNYDTKVLTIECNKCGDVIELK